jgi:hypothetical protein
MGKEVRIRKGPGANKRRVCTTAWPEGKRTETEREVTGNLPYMGSSNVKAEWLQ